MGAIRASCNQLLLSLADITIATISYPMRCYVHVTSVRRSVHVFVNATNFKPPPIRRKKAFQEEHSIPTFGIDFRLSVGH